MTAPDDSENSRPISVAELLAKNGTIGSPPVGGRRRRRRGNSDAVTVAELTGEIPIIRTGEIPIARDVEVTDVEVAEEAVADEAVADETVEEETAAPEPVETPATNGSAPAVEKVADEPARPFDAPPPRADSPLPRRDRSPERSYDPRPLRRPEQAPAAEAAEASGAEQMAFDPLDEAAPALDLAPDEQVTEAAELQSYLRSSGGTLFSGQTVADDRARRGLAQDDEYDGGAVAVATDADSAVAESLPREGKLTTLWRALLVVGQSILAVAFGAGLFIAFDQLWRWNNIVALVLSVLVILGLVVAVRIVRKTEDIASTLIAVAVGALVTLGPLALLQST
ncbi:hypothetical protein [Mycolicibacterium sphagni]|uniref:Transmembrane protein n=1 Tax=Mycolicibacterium sphagni TaxID=1786 RepID=A0ABX2K426_9MYCO|nr:hypothetical protein [Mycolicibacterium sphagni]NTY62465.1 hypothetical protein [Mycolicibacterium sphagni]